jgi:uncharacterized nucleotidyltransferase DUF6036
VTPQPSASRPLDAPSLLRALGRHAVDFVVIGGFSLAAHGVVRGTKDLDIVPEPSEANLARLMIALEELDAQPIELADFRAEELPYPLNLDGLLAGGNWALSTRHGRLDVMQYVEGIGDYEQLRQSAAEFEIDDKSYAFAGLDDLVAMKRAAGRPQDLIDIADLERGRG